MTGTSSVPFEGFKALRGSNGPKRFTIDFFNDIKSLPRYVCCKKQNIEGYTAKTSLVVLTAEWLPWLQANWRDIGYETFAVVLDTNYIRHPKGQPPSSSCNHNTLKTFRTSVNESLQMHFLMEAGDSLTNVLRVVSVLWLASSPGHSQILSHSRGVLWLYVELGCYIFGCLMQLDFRTTANLS